MMEIPMDATALDDKEYKELLEAVRFVYGYDFTEYAESTVKRRIVHFMNTHRIGTPSALGKMLLRDEPLFEEFVQHLSITVTEMFRDPSFYKKLREIVMPQLATYPVIKLWVAGCATGQEAYSMAILLKEAGLLERSIIYATDINQRSLQTAKKGIYPLDGMKNYTKNYLAAGGQGEFSRYYAAHHAAVLLDRSLHDNIVFSPHNLVTDRSFNEFQLVLCRNVIIYFNQRLQEKVLRLLYDSLCPFGYLGLGDKESLFFSDKRTNFEEIDRKEKIYRKIK
ncbi:CheR family methyltransferase [Dawidia soli]|nr:protein-glutamate O-methyltransferase CheR [Dawidia soli]